MLKNFVKIILCLSLNAWAEDRSPDKLGVFGPKNGVYTIKAEWKNHKFTLNFKGDMDSPENQRIMSEWIKQCGQEVYGEAVYDR